MRTIDTIVVHCSATKPSQVITVDVIRDWHTRQRGWSDIGYHYVIERDGTLQHGRPLRRAGAHVKGHNKHSIGVCLVGGINEGGQPDCNFTFAQYRALNDFISCAADIIEHCTDTQMKGDSLRVTGHRSFDAMKACPVFDVASFFQHR